MDGQETNTENNINTEPTIIMKTKETNFFKAGFFVLVIFILLVFGWLAFAHSQGKVVFSIPLSINDPAVLRASFVYAFKTKVVSVEEKSGKTILKTDLKRTKELPEFIIDENTRIAIVQNGVDFNSKDTGILKPGTPIYLYLAYNLKERRWLTTRIAIVNPVKPAVKLLPSSFTRKATPSAKLKAK